MQRWAFAVYAHQIKTESFVNNIVQKQSVAVLEASNEHEANGLARAIALKLFPIRDGWMAHSSTVCSADNIVTLEHVGLTSE